MTDNDIYQNCKTRENSQWTLKTQITVQHNNAVLLECLYLSHASGKEVSVLRRQAIMSHSRTATWGLLIISRLWEPETTAQPKQPQTQTPRQGQIPGPRHTGDHSCLRTSDMFSARKLTTNKEKSLLCGK